jgi:hypothetical protein
MAKLRINGDSSGYVDLEAPNAASSSTLDLDQVPQKNAGNTFTSGQNITVPGNGGLTIQAGTNGSASLRLKNDATDWDVNCQTTDNFAIYNHTTGGNRLGITPAGIVTMPAQPYFSASCAGNAVYATFASGVALPFNSTGKNDGLHFNTSNYRFTAPVNGKYLFAVGFITNSASPTGRPSFWVNGSQDNLGIKFGINGSSTAGAGGTQASAIIYLSANDYVDVRSQSQNIIAYCGNGHSSFTGILVN